MKREIGKPAQHIWVLVTILDGKGTKSFYQSERQLGTAIDYQTIKFKDATFRVFRYYFNREIPISDYRLSPLNNDNEESDDIST
jgi:hypothetical protein